MFTKNIPIIEAIIPIARATSGNKIPCFYFSYKVGSYVGSLCIYIPPPSWANKATNEAPKAKPTIRDGASFMSSSWPDMPPYARNKVATPNKDKAVTASPVTAPPFKAIRQSQHVAQN